ncbi:MAG TPA: fluoride efflux transporter CrcB [Anaerolineae bacterium]|nr:fluoride efflux transporter CrcB [Anaerolineae bacterium]
MLELMIIGAGGFLGAISRYLLAGWVQSVSRSAYFPFGTLAVNVMGSFLLGFLARSAVQQQVLGPEARMFLLIGFLGAFTTFSTFSLETLTLLADGALGPAFANMAANLLLGLVAAWAGQALALLIWS